MFNNFYNFTSKFLGGAIVIFFLFSQQINAQSGTIQGRVVDKSTKESLSGANIVVKGTSLGTASDFNGNYKIPNVGAGTQVLVVSYIGYQSQTTDITVTDNQTTEVNIELEAEVIEGSTVVVTAQAKGQLAAINEQLSSNRIINVVSAEKMQELPDANLAESIGRLPGISLQRSSGEAEKVVIRGLSPKYNLVSVEGIPMVSTNDYDRSVDLSLIGDDLVKGVEVSKSLRADMDADAIGGTINLTLREAPKDFHYNVQGNGGYNDLGGSWKNYKFSGSVSNRFLEDQFGVRLQLNAENKQLPSDQFNANYETPTLNTQIGSDSGKFISNSGSVNLTDNNTERQRYGASVILDYTTDFVDLKLFNLYNQKDDDVIARENWTRFSNTNQEYGFQKYTRVYDTKTESRTHSLQSLFKIWDTRLNIALSYTRADANTPGQIFQFFEANVPQHFGTYDRIFAQPSGLLDTMGTGDVNSATLQQMDKYKTKLLDETYDTKLDYYVPFKLSDFLSGTLSFGAKYHQKNRSSDNFQEFVNFEYGEGAARRDDLKAKFPWIQGSLTLQRGIEAINFLDPDYDAGNFLDGRWKLGWAPDADLLLSLQDAYYPQASGSLYKMNGTNNYQQDYTTEENLSGGYLMGEFNVGNYLTVVPGVRYEKYTTDYRAFHIVLNSQNGNGISGVPLSKEYGTDNDYFFPSVNIKYRATENIQIQGAIFRSVSRPSFRQISPLVIYGEASAVPRIQSNNPYLKPSTAWNFDLGVSIFGNEIGLFTTNIFYKEMDDLIYTIQNYLPYQTDKFRDAPEDIFDRLPTSINYYDTTWAKNNNGLTAVTNIPMNNPETAYIKGIEFSWQTNLWYLPGLLSGIVLDLNLSFIDSYTFYPYFETIQVGGTRFAPIYNYFYRTRRGDVEDQPKAIYNVILGWDYKGFSSRFSARYQQVTLTSLDTKFELRDSYYDNVLLIDITLKQEIVENLSVYTNFTNINIHIDDYYLTIPGYYEGAEGNLPTSQQLYGFRAQFGVSFNY